MRSPVTALVELYNSLSEVEQKVFLDLVDPQPEPEPVAKQTRKKRGARSARASGMATAIRNSLAQGKQAAADAPQSNVHLCTAMLPGLDVVCGEMEDCAIHDSTAGYAAYHPFVSSAQPVEKKSRRKGAAASSTPSTEVETVTASGVGAGG